MRSNLIFVYGTLLIGFSILYVISKFFYKNSLKKGEEIFLKKHKNAVKIYTKSGGFIVTNTMQVYSVNGENITQFIDDRGSGVFAIPGNNELEVEFSWTRPGILHKRVTTSTGVVKFEVELKANRSYNLIYDKKENEFKIDEI